MLKRRPARKKIPKPSSFDVRAWFAEMDRLGSGTFGKDARKQPKTPNRKIFDKIELVALSDSDRFGPTGPLLW
jgi:hypothetical protein